jgi:hypothetical protein
MDNRHHYGVFFRLQGPERYAGCYQLARWARYGDKQSAVRHARTVHGYVVRVGYGRSSAWDAPTLRVSGDVVADFRQ